MFPYFTSVWNRIRRRLLSREPPSVLTAIIPAYPGGCGMSPHSCGMAAIPVRPENHGTRAAGAYGDGPYLLPPCLLPLRQLHPSAAVSRLLSPGLCCLPASAVSCPPPFLVLRRFLSASSPVRHAAGQKPPARTCPRSGRQCVALYQPVCWILFTTIPLVLGALVEMPE